MWCPRCDQGNVRPATIIKTGEFVQVCEECDALWRSDVDVAPSGFTDFKTYVAPLGLMGLWSELEMLSEP